MRRVGGRIPVANLPAWDHPEHGLYLAKICSPACPFDELYFNLLSDLLKRKWHAIMLSSYAANAPAPTAPRAIYGRLFQGGPGSFYYVPMVLADLTASGTGPAWEAVQDGIRKTKTDVITFKSFAYVSPWFEWELVDYWENNYFYL